MLPQTHGPGKDLVRLISNATRQILRLTGITNQKECECEQRDVTYTSRKSECPDLPYSCHQFRKSLELYTCRTQKVHGAVIRGDEGVCVRALKGVFGMCRDRLSKETLVEGNKNYGSVRG